MAQTTAKAKQTTINQPEKRFVPISRYCEISGLSYATVDHLLKSGQVPFITTESGQRRIDTRPLDSGQGMVISRLSELEGLVKALCGHLGVCVSVERR